jgi:hypothetical protein
VPAHEERAEVAPAVVAIMVRLLNQSEGRFIAASVEDFACRFERPRSSGEPLNTAIDIIDLTCGKR